jgi:hypothetical protein
LIAFLAALLGALATGGTLAWLATNAAPLANSFSPARVTCAVEKSFDAAAMKLSNVRVRNAGDTAAYLRVRLVTYRQNAAGEIIGGAAALPAFAPGSGWEQAGDYYYYEDPVPAGGGTGALIAECTLETYENGESQVLEVLAEAVQSAPADAVLEAWGRVPGSGM